MSATTLDTDLVHENIPLFSQKKGSRRRRKENPRNPPIRSYVTRQTAKNEICKTTDDRNKRDSCL
jgi:hypothetical protein